jgi:hypothetical protein
MHPRRVHHTPGPNLGANGVSPAILRPSSNNLAVTRRLRLCYDRRNVLVLHHLIKCRHIGLHDLRKLLQLCVDLS